MSFLCGLLLPWDICFDFGDSSFVESCWRNLNSNYLNQLTIWEAPLALEWWFYPGLFSTLFEFVLEDFWAWLIFRLPSNYLSKIDRALITPKQENQMAQVFQQLSLVNCFWLVTYIEAELSCHHFFEKIYRHFLTLQF